MINRNICQNKKSGSFHPRIKYGPVTGVFRTVVQHQVKARVSWAKDKVLCRHESQVGDVDDIYSIYHRYAALLCVTVLVDNLYPTVHLSFSVLVHAESIE